MTASLITLILRFTSGTVSDNPFANSGDVQKQQSGLNREATQKGLSGLVKRRYPPPPLRLKLTAVISPILTIKYCPGAAITCF
jgi:hypothetical protein